MSTVQVAAAFGTPRPQAVQKWVGEHTLAAFFLLAYAISWSCWLIAYVVGGAVGMVIFIIGGFGPAIAALVVTRLTGGSVRAWASRIVSWRAPSRFYLYALGLPALLFSAMNLELALLGENVDASLLFSRLPAYLLTLVFVAILGGGLEEPGWRGYALGRLQERHTPLWATLILGLLWGVWHVPIYGPAGFVVPLGLAFFYTYLFNKTGSILLCVLLHGSLTPPRTTSFSWPKRPMASPTPPLPSPTSPQRLYS